jgi:RNA polymerase sigma-70 factor (ECF subfamily)
MRLMDPSLLARARGGDRTALEQLLQEIAPLVQRFGLRMCRHQADAEDVLQDTLLAVVHHLGEFEGRSSLASWVFMLARTACARRRRGAKNRPHLPEEAAGDRPALGSDPEAAADQGELRAALEQALQALPEDQREVLLLRDMEGLSAAEAAESVGISVEALKSRLHRARAGLRKAFDAALARAAPAPTTHCPDVLAALSQKLEGDLNAQDCAAMEAHVAQCAACGAACTALKTALGMCRAEASGELSDATRAQVQSAVRALLTQR